MPRVATLAISKDPQICDPESHKVRDLERLIIGEQGGVREHGRFPERHFTRQGNGYPATPTFPGPEALPI